MKVGLHEAKKYDGRSACSNKTKTQMRWLQLACGFKAEPRKTLPVNECGENANIFGLREVCGTASSVSVLYVKNI